MTSECEFENVTGVTFWCKKIRKCNRAKAGVLFELLLYLNLIVCFLHPLAYRQSLRPNNSCIYMLYLCPWTSRFVQIQRSPACLTRTASSYLLSARPMCRFGVWKYFPEKNKIMPTPIEKRKPRR